MHIFETGKFINQNGQTTAQKNIYDVAGNLWEFTTEKIIRDANLCVMRGGGARSSGLEDPATYRHGSYSKTDSGWLAGFRAVLYVK